MKNNLLKKGLLSILVFALLFIGFTSCNKQSPVDKQHSSWMDYGGGPDQSKFVIQNQITKENVNQLETAWTYDTGDDRTYQDNPIIVDSTMYILAKNNSLIALNALTGKEIWIHAELNGISRRGFTYWESKDRKNRRLFFFLNSSLQAIDAITGKSILTFGERGVVDLREGLDRDPDKVLRIASHTPGKVFDNLLIIGSSPGESYLTPPGHLRAYDVITGERVWTFRTIPHPGEYGYETWPEEAYKYVGGVNCWGEISIDEERGIAYVPLGSPTYDYYGADRKGSNLFANCLLALDAKTGKRLWHFQTVHHDLWDYDLASAPQLITVNHNGKSIDAVTIATKQGFMFAFDRVTGEPLWPIEERSVPPSNIPEEEAWPTQPFPTVLPAFNRQIFTENDLSNIFLSEEEFESWTERIKNAKKGLFTPPDTTETISIPGAVGGANWGNTASNPEKGLVYIMSQDYPSFYKLNRGLTPRSAAWQARFSAQQSVQKGHLAYNQRCQVCHAKDLSGTSGPSLLSIANRLDINFMRNTLLYGTGRMPPIEHIEEEEIGNILAFLKDESTGNNSNVQEKKPIEGPVVASGGAPAEKEFRSIGTNDRGGNNYPEEVDVPAQRYYTGYGLGRAYLIKPPWTSITAYDMNTGTIKWKRPLGEDEHALAKGIKNTGVPAGSQRNGLIVTSTGIVFATVNNGQIYAYDADNGDILWQAQTSMGIGTMPSMYEINGRVYLVVSATRSLVKGWNLSREESQSIPNKNKDGVYQVFALPQIKN